MIASLFKAFLEALFGTAIAAWRAQQADKNLEALGYSKGQRDAAVSQIKASNAVVEAQARMAAVATPDRAAVVDSLSRGEF